MNIAVLFGSQRNGGTHALIEERLNSLKILHHFDFIRMAETKIAACVACEGCTQTGTCVLPQSQDDQFQNVLDRLIESDAIVIVTPVYAPIPSRLTALFERLLSISFFSHEFGKLERPLKGKRTAIITYDSGTIGDDTQIKMIFQRFLMDNYSFTKVDYDFINNHQNPNAEFESVLDYVEHTIRSM